MDNKQLFKDSVENKINETIKAFDILYENKLYGACIATLRMQLDILVRINYLLRHRSDEDRLLNMFSQGTRWHNDRHMLNYLDFGWDQLVYKFGCSFIHLSRLSNYDQEDILQVIDIKDKENIINYINQYHGANLDDHSTLNQIFSFLPNIHKKIVDHNFLYLSSI